MSILRSTTTLMIRWVKAIRFPLQDVFVKLSLKNSTQSKKSLLHLLTVLWGGSLYQPQSFARSFSAILKNISIVNIKKFLWRTSGFAVLWRIWERQTHLVDLSIEKRTKF